PVGAGVSPLLGGELPQGLRAGAAAPAVDPVGAVLTEAGLLREQHVGLELTGAARRCAVGTEAPVRGSLVERRAAAHGLGDALTSGQLPLLRPALVLL